MNKASPIDVERLNSITKELESERNKATSALSQCGQLRLEVSELTEQFRSQSIEFNLLNDTCDAIESDLNNTKLELSESKSIIDTLNDDILSKDNEIYALNEQNQKIFFSREELQKRFESKESECSTVLIKFETLQTSAHAAEENISRLNEELCQLRAQLERVEFEKLDLYERTSALTDANENMRLELEHLRSVGNRFESLTTSTDSLRESYQMAVETVETQRVDLRLLTNKYDDQTALLAQLDAMGNAVMNERDSLIEKLAALKQAYEEQTERIEAEVRAGDAAREQAEYVNQGRDSLSKQLTELRNTYEQSVERNANTDAELTLLTNANAALNSELTEARDKIKEQRVLLAQADESQVSKYELENLRVQLSVLKQQQARREVEEDNPSHISQKVADAIQASKTMYEGIVNELKAEVKRLNSENHILEARLETFRRQAARVEQLQEEKEMYKNMSASSLNERDEANRATELAQERSLKISQEVQSLKHQLHRQEMELESSRLEVEDLKANNTQLCELNKQCTSRYLNADKAAAEIKTTNSQLKYQLEEERQQRESAVLDVDRTVSATQDLRRQVNDLRGKEKQLATLQQQYRTATAELQELRLTSAQRERELSGQVDTLRSANTTQQTEMQSVRERVVGQKQTIESLNAEIEKLVGRVESVSNEKERFRREVQQSEALRVENEMAELRQDIQTTTDDWKEMEREKVQRDKALAALQSEANKERAAKELLKYNSQLLEERLRVVTQELAVFKSLDVYHSSMQLGLQSYRESRTTGQQQLASSQQGISNGSYAFNSSAVKSLHGQQALFRGSSTARGPMALADMNSSRYEHNLQDPDDNHVPSSLSGGAVLSHQTLNAHRHDKPPPPLSRRNVIAQHDPDNRSVISDLPGEFDLSIASHGGKEESSDEDEGSFRHEPRRSNNATTNYASSSKTNNTYSRGVHEQKSGGQQHQHPSGGSVTGGEEDEDRQTSKRARDERLAVRERQLREKLMQESSKNGGGVSAAERARAVLSSSRIASSSQRRADAEDDDSISQISRTSVVTSQSQVQSERGRPTQRYGERPTPSEPTKSNQVRAGIGIAAGRAVERVAAPVAHQNNVLAQTPRSSNLFVPTATDLIKARRAANK